MADRPNILYVFTDQQSSCAMNCAGNVDIDTPAMDSIAQTGVLFENAYCAQPLCGPSRCSIMTGFMPHETSVDANGSGIPESLHLQSMGPLFESAGYECVYGGKWHLPGKWLEEGHGFRPVAGFGDHDLASDCIEFLKQRHEKPFLLVVSFDNPHNIFEWALNVDLPWGAIPDVPTEECPNLPPNFAIPAFEPGAIRVEQAAQPVLFPGRQFTEEQWRHYRHAYYRLVEKADAGVGRILRVLQDGGLLDDTLIIFTSDHGDGNGAHHWHQKQVLYEESIRIPFIVSFKGVTKAAHVDRVHVVSNGLDTIPTLCDYAGIDPPPGLRGRSIRPMAEGGESDEWFNECVIETKFLGGRGFGTRGRVLRTDRYKYTVYLWGPYREQLIDMHEDPGEMVNLAVEAKYRNVLADHRDRLARWCDESKDDFVVPRSA